MVGSTLYLTINREEVKEAADLVITHAKKWVNKKTILLVDYKEIIQKLTRNSSFILFNMILL